MNAPLLSLRGVGKVFTLHALGRTIEGCRDVTFDVQQGEFVGVIGRSGSGKSTVLRLIHRTYLPQTGCILYRSLRHGDVDLARVDERTMLDLRRHEIGYVSQFLHVIPRTTARAVVEGAARAAGIDERQAAQDTERLLEHFELPSRLWDASPLTFSGGEKLRLNVARAMATRPRLLLLDEPTASLDDAAKARVRDVLLRLKQDGTTMLGIFHDLGFLSGIADRTLAMANGVMGG